MKIDNSPLPPFSKGGEGGFETYFLRNSKFQFQITQTILFGILNFVHSCLPLGRGSLFVIWCLGFGASPLYALCYSNIFPGFMIPLGSKSSLIFLIN